MAWHERIGKMKSTLALIDGNEAAAYIAFKTNEVIAIYPITPVYANGRASGRVGRSGGAEPVG